VLLSKENRQTDRHYENNGHLAVNQYFHVFINLATSFHFTVEFNHIILSFYPQETEKRKPGLPHTFGI